MNLKKIVTNKYFIWCAVIVVAVGGYMWYRSSTATKTETRYAFSTVQKDTVVSSISGTGQIYGESQLDIQPKASGTVTKILVKVGDRVKAGTPMMQLDTTDAIKTIRDAEQALSQAQISYQSAQLQLQKAKEPADVVTMTQAQDALSQAQRNLDTLKSGPTDYELAQAQANVDSAAKNIKMTDDGTMPQNVRDAYDQYVSVLKQADQTAVKALNDGDSILGQDNVVVPPSLLKMFSIMDLSYKNTALEAYDSSKTAINTADVKVSALKDQNESTVNIDQAATSETAALNQLVVLLSNLSDGLRSTLTSNDLTQNQLSGYQSTIDSDLSDVNGKVTSLVNQIQAVRQAKDSYSSAQIAYAKSVNSFNNLKAGATAADISTAEEKVKEAQAQVDKLKSGADAVDLEISQNSLSQQAVNLATARNKLQDANDALKDYTITAPFDGVVGKIVPLQSAQVSSGSSVITLITAQQLADISLNEVDAAKVKVGQKATMTFDAIDGLTMTGQVAEVSQIGTVSQGVVSYDIKIALDGEDSSIKPGMSVSASIVTQVDSDVLTVPNSAVKTSGTQHYVETLEIASSTKADANGFYASSDTPQRVAVEIGIADDSITEITSGLTEGQKVVSQTIKSTTATTASTSASTSRTSSSASLMRVTAGAVGGGGPRGD